MLSFNCITFNLLAVVDIFLATEVEGPGSDPASEVSSEIESLVCVSITSVSESFSSTFTTHCIRSKIDSFYYKTCISIFCVFRISIPVFACFDEKIIIFRFFDFFFWLLSFIQIFFVFRCWAFAI